MEYLNQIIIIAAKYLIAVPILLFIFFLFSEKTNRKRFIIYAFSSFILIYLISLIMGLIIYNPRPFVVDNSQPLFPHLPDNGFPSQHTLLAAAIACVIFFFSKKLGLFLWTIAILIGIGRVLAGVHHPIDIFASIIIALTGALIVYYFMFVFNKKMFRKR